MPQRVERKLMAILAADVAGYSKLMGAAPCVVQLSRIGTQLGCLDISSSPVRLGRRKTRQTPSRLRDLYQLAKSIIVMLHRKNPPA